MSEGPGHLARVQRVAQARAPALQALMVSGDLQGQGAPVHAAQAQAVLDLWGEGGPRSPDPNAQMTQDRAAPGLKPARRPREEATVGQVM